MEREDIQPWYRQFWPWFIIAMLASSVIAGLTTVWISMQTNDSLVIDSSDGMQIVAERRFDAERQATDLNLTALLHIDRTTGAVQAEMLTGRLVYTPTTVELELTHPTLAERDQLITLHRAPPAEGDQPLWSGHFVEIAEGRWYVTLKSQDQWRLSGEWHGDSPLMLRPAESGDADGR